MMVLAPLPTVMLRPVAFFPRHYFLENLAVRADGSVLVTAVLQKQLWWVAATKPDAVVDRVLVHTFDHPVTGIAEVAPDVFIVSLTEAYTNHESHLARIDFNGWKPWSPVSPETVYTFDERARGLNGTCLLGPNVLAVADSFAGLIWRVDLAEDGRVATARQRSAPHCGRPLRRNTRRPVQRRVGAWARRSRPGRLRDDRRRHHRAPERHRPPSLSAARRAQSSGRIMNRHSTFASSTGSRSRPRLPRCNHIASSVGSTASERSADALPMRAVTASANRGHGRARAEAHTAFRALLIDKQL